MVFFLAVVSLLGAAANNRFFSPESGKIYALKHNQVQSNNENDPVVSVEARKLLFSKLFDSHQEAPSKALANVKKGTLAVCGKLCNWTLVVVDSLYSWTLFIVEELYGWMLIIGNELKEWIILIAPSSFKEFVNDSADQLKSWKAYIDSTRLMQFVYESLGYIASGLMQFVTEGVDKIKSWLSPKTIKITKCMGVLSIALVITIWGSIYHIRGSEKTTPEVVEEVAKEGLAAIEGVKILANASSVSLID